MKLFLCYYLLLCAAFIYGLVANDTELIFFVGGAAIGSFLGIYFERRHNN